MLQRTFRFVQFVAASCCLLAATTGCNLHRDSHGYVLRGQWALECGDVGCLPANGVAGQCDYCSDCAVCAADQAKPEVLPWRARLKTRIGDRLFHRGEFGVQQCSDEGATEAAHHPMQSAPLPAAPSNPPDKPGDPEKLPPAKATDLEIPKPDFSKPESNRPDVVME